MSIIQNIIITSLFLCPVSHCKLEHIVRKTRFILNLLLVSSIRLCMQEELRAEFLYW